ncbi:MAG: molybdopterin-dependent oxidoreductase [Acidimicrobiales bacterium]
MDSCPRHGRDIGSRQRCGHGQGHGVRGDGPADGHAPGDGGVRISGRAFPTNNGGLCVKGWTAGDLLDHPERLTRPVMRATAPDGLRPCSWDDALAGVAAELARCKERHGRDAAGSSAAVGSQNEKAYVLGKFAGWRSVPSMSTTTAASAVVGRDRFGVGPSAWTGACPFRAPRCVDVRHWESTHKGVLYGLSRAAAARAHGRGPASASACRFPAGPETT